MSPCRCWGCCRAGCLSRCRCPRVSWISRRAAGLRSTPTWLDVRCISHTCQQDRGSRPSWAVRSPRCTTLTGHSSTRPGSRRMTPTPIAPFDTVLEAYAHARVDRPDKHLERRARLAGELKLVSELLTAVGSKDQEDIEAGAARLRKLDADTFEEDLDEAVAPATPAAAVSPAAADNPSETPGS